MITLPLHLLAVQVLLGALALVCLWALTGRLHKSRERLDAARALARPLPVLMTFLINLGVPPLLFAQVLYGRVLYTSSILIGTFWISVVLLLMGVYQFIYFMGGRSARPLRLGVWSLAALAVVVKVALIFTNNVTLMVRPEVWGTMQASGPGGGSLAAPGDPTLIPRWLFLILGSFATAGVAVTLVGRQGGLPAAVATPLRRGGAWLTVLGSLAQLGGGFWLFSLHAPETREAVLASPFYLCSCIGLLVTAALLLATGIQAIRRAAPRSGRWVLAGAAVAVLNAVTLVLAREGIREATLRVRGFDIWQRTVASNWGVVALFLVLLLGGVASQAGETEP